MFSGRARPLTPPPKRVNALMTATLSRKRERVRNARHASRQPERTRKNQFFAGQALEAIQYLSNTVRQSGLRERLLEHSDARIEPALMDDCIPRISRHVYNLHTRFLRLQDISQLPAIHSWENHVREQQIEMGPLTFERLLTVALT